MTNTIDACIEAMQSGWVAYIARSDAERLLEFAVIVNSLSEHFNRLHFSHLTHLCEGLERTVLDTLEHHSHGKLSEQSVIDIQHQINTLLATITSFVPKTSVQGNRETDVSQASLSDTPWLNPRLIWITASENHAEMVTTLATQLQFFGFNPQVHMWDADLNDTDTPLAVVFIPQADSTSADESEYIKKLRAYWPTSQLLSISNEEDIEPVVHLMRAGIDINISLKDQSSILLNCILDLVQVQAQEKSKVLIVDDSKVAVKLIELTLNQHGIETEAINDPSILFEVLKRYQPDLILMDMQMPRFNGIEATRVLRQSQAYRAIPIVYLSGESSIAMQVEALRLGGDQFLIKPTNPVLLAAVVTAKIERFREVQRNSTIDGLTGLLNHTASKIRLKSMINQLKPAQNLTVVMIDIDHFKSVNDTYGHPVGDQVIRSLAWLLKGRLRGNDLVGRYGGEEFIIALHDVDITQAIAVIDRIRSAFATLPHAQGALYTTFSAGVASYGAEKDPSMLTEFADNALLQAKRLGRNRVEKT